MIANARPRRRLARLAGTIAAGVFAAAAIGLGATACRTAGTAAAAATVRAAGAAGAAGAKAATTAATASVAAASAATPARVPWSKVGRGWELVQYTTGATGKPAPVTLYLIDPAGHRYALYTWGAHDSAPYLIGWSGDKARALFIVGANQYEQLTLATGTLSRGALPRGAEPIGYAGPGGRNILGVVGGNSSTLARYSLAGRLLKRLTRGVDETGATYSANGAELAVTWNKGLELVSNGGGVLRSLPVPGTDSVVGCTSARWWNATTLLATCLAKNAFGERLWLVPTDGKRPVPLTPQRGTGRIINDANDNADLGAWRLRSGLYLQSSGGVPCTSARIYRQAGNQSITRVSPPDTNADADAIVTAFGPRLLIDTTSGCLAEMDPTVTTSLLWYNPATHAEQWVLRAPAGAGGVSGVEAYDAAENAPGFAA
jgi:hypothetical protein